MEQITTTSRPDFSVLQLQRSGDEELVNAITHGIGLAMAAVGSLVMMTSVTAQGNTRLAVGCAAYLFMLVAVYAMSTISHTVTVPKWRMFFRQLDQGFIYLLVVGTYTPYSLAYLNGTFWNVMLTFMWCYGLVGFASKAIFAHRIETGSVLPYLFLGWMSVIALPQIWQVAPPQVFGLILAGGMCYTIGTFFLLNDTKVRHFHAAWHLWVIAGSTCHFMGLLVYAVQGGV